MTLVLTLLLPQVVAQVSDRRLVLTDGTYRDQENKVILVESADGHFAISYSGLAEVGSPRFSTMHFLLDCLRGAPNREARHVLRSIKKELENVYRHFPESLQQKALVIVAAGWKTNGTPMMNMISNFIYTDGKYIRSPSKSFFMEHHRPNRIIAFRAHGTPQADPRWKKIELESYTWAKNHIPSRLDIHDLSPYELVHNYMYSLLLETRKEQHYRRFIGESCMSIVMTREDRLAYARYYPGLSQEPITHQPAVVTKNFIIAHGMMAGRTLDKPGLNVIGDLNGPNLKVLMPTGGLLQLPSDIRERFTFSLGQETVSSGGTTRTEGTEFPSDGPATDR